MRYVFFGSPHLAAIILTQLIERGLPPAALVCNPDRPVGRRQTLKSPEAKIVIERFSTAIPIFQPEKLPEIREQLHTVAADMFVVAAYAKIIPADIVNMPPYGTLGIHPSLLPHYRGATPIQSALLAGETTTGVTIYKLDEQMDHGPIVAQVSLPIENEETYKTLEEKLGLAGAHLLADIAQRYCAGTITEKPQHHTEATYTKKFSVSDGYVNEAEVAAAVSGENLAATLRVDRLIRALGHEPGVWTMHNGRRVKLLKAKLHGGKLHLILIQPEGKKPQNAPKTGL